MKPRFVAHHPAIRRNQRERYMFIAALGLATSLLIMTVFVMYSKTEARINKPVVTKTQPERPAIATVMLLAPSRNVTAGTKLSDVAFEPVYWPRHQVQEGAVKDKSEVASLYAKTTLPAGMPIVRSSLSSVPSQSSLPVRPGYRAIAINIDATSGIEGHARPGSMVDVLLTHVKDGNKGTKIIVQNARVLSLGGKTEQRGLVSAQAQAQGQALGFTSAPISRSTITLEVLVEDALNIQTAKTMGRLSLLLRSADETEAPDVLEVDGNDVLGQESTRPASTTAAKKACSKGQIRMSGREYTLNCDGTLSELHDRFEP